MIGQDSLLLLLLDKLRVDAENKNKKISLFVGVNPWGPMIILGKGNPFLSFVPKKRSVENKLDSCVSDTFPPYVPRTICATPYKHPVPYMCHALYVPCTMCAMPYMGHAVQKTPMLSVAP